MRSEILESNYDSDWYAVRIRSRQEKSVAKLFMTMGVAHFLPLRNQIREWSDRKQMVSTPLFSGYLFVRRNIEREGKLQILKVPGVVGFVGNHTGPLPIPIEQIEDIHTVLSNTEEYEITSFQEGDRVRVIRGALTGVHGRLVRVKSSTRLIVSVEMVHQALAVDIATSDVVPVKFLPKTQFPSHPLQWSAAV